MATSGSKTIAVTNYDDLKFSWSQTSQSVANNTTTISWKLELIAKTYGTIYSSVSKNWSVTVNGNKYSGTNTVGITAGQTITLASGSTTIPHGNDGSKTFSYSFTQEFGITFSGVYIGSKSGNGTGTLNTIKRVSVLGTINSFTIGNAITIPITKYQASYTDTLSVSLNGTTIKTVSSITNGYSLTFSDEQLQTIYSLMPNSTIATFTFKLTSKNGGTPVGASLKSVKGTIASNVIPKINSVTISEGNSNVTWGFYVQNKSKLKIVVGGNPSTGSILVSTKIECDGKSYNGYDLTTATITSSGSVQVKVTITDSRGRTATKTNTISVVAYSSPYINAFNVVRANANGVADATGNCALVTLNAGVSSCDSKNNHYYYVKYKSSNASSYTTELISSASSTFNGTYLIQNIDTNYSYDFMAVVNDSFESYSKSAKPLPTAYVTVDYLSGGKGIAFGKVAEIFDAFDCFMNALFRKLVRFSSTSFGNVIIKREGSTKGAGIGFENDNGVLGYVGMLDGANGGLYRWESDYASGVQYKILDTGNFVDSGWKTATLQSGFTTYTSATPVKYRKHGNLVEIRGAVKPTATITGGTTEHPIFYLPEEFKPSQKIVQRCQGSGLNTWSFVVDSSGAVSFGRYGSGTSYVDAGTNAWLTFQITYFVD